MSKSFGPLDTPEDFHAALSRCLAYARSETFWYPPMKRGVELQLQAIHAWTSHRRQPLWAEREAVNLGWAFAREREGMTEEPLDWVELVELTSRVCWWFACWPMDESSAKNDVYYGSTCAPRRPSLEELAVVTDGLRAALRLVGGGGPRPPDEAFQSRQPFFRDQMSTPAWVEWVLIPRLESHLSGGSPLPARSQLAQASMHLAATEAGWPLLYALGAVDELFVQPILPNHRP